MVEKIDHSVEIRSKSPDDNLATEHDEKEMRNNWKSVEFVAMNGLTRKTIVEMRGLTLEISLSFTKSDSYSGSVNSSTLPYSLCLIRYFSSIPTEEFSENSTGGMPISKKTA